MVTTNQETILSELKELLTKDLKQTFEAYGENVEKVLTPMRWKPLVLIVGNYSSGKSTFINELIGKDIQRTGQAPTDDSFTVLAYAENEEDEENVPGNTVVNDPNLPFEFLRAFGHSFISHFRLKRVHSPILRDFALIDTPGMLDSVTEKDRGYDYLGVIGELAKLSDVIVLMFDPHKAGTIKETYEAIRGTLPSSTGEDRVIYCLNRIDECDNIQDLVRSYGTLCWNLSQMTGRKDMPRIYLTYSPHHMQQRGLDVSAWENERDELIATIKTAPRMRLSHILQDAERAVRELGTMVEFFKNFKEAFWERALPTIKIGAISAVLAFFMGDVFLNLLTGFPDSPLLSDILSGDVGFSSLILPVVNGVLVMALFIFYLQRIVFPRLVKRVLTYPDDYIELETRFKQDLWKKVRAKALSFLRAQAPRLIWMRHVKALSKIETFLNHHLERLYREITY